MNTCITLSKSLTDRPSRLYLWKQRSFYLGPISNPVIFSQGAASFAVSLGGTIQFTARNQSKTISSRSILIPPGTEMICDTGAAPVAICMLDALCSDYSGLLPLMQNRLENIAYEVSNEARYIEEFTTLFHEEPQPEEIYLSLEELLCNTRSKDNCHTIDPRIAKVVSLIQEHISDNLSIETLADRVALSVPRLTQLFRIQTGVPIRRYRLWHRLYRSVAKLAVKENLTNSAIDAGFSDASHFNRTFKSMFGMTPTDLLMQSNGLKIFAEPL